MVMPRRAGGRLRKRVRQYRWRALRQAGPAMTLVVLLGPPIMVLLGIGLPALIGVLLGVWPPVLLATPFKRGAVCGVVLVGAAWWFREIAYVLGARAERDRKGAEGEAATGDVLRPLRRRGWRVVHDIEFPGQGNVDHLLIGTRGVIAVDSKYTTERLFLRGNKGIEGSHRGFIGEAKWAATLAKRALSDIGYPNIPVEPALVFWGPGAPDIDGGHRTIQNTLVLEGREAKQWRGALSERPEILDPATVKEVTERLKRFRESSTAT